MTNGSECTNFCMVSMATLSHIRLQPLCSLLPARVLLPKNTSQLTSSCMLS
ncbi:hypothetical protein JG688_00010180 [Phytophthora aleatoria]|uniref:Uncharacterized protein n=1 Tax=Phytophthora aleatoria TaxID=2496075 RepID=A0A8J5IWE7_9STRA|nr:hypothetical protein JG688_00010180 [Phytophthora aleatoria]